MDVIFENTGVFEAQVAKLSFPYSYTQTAGTTLLNGGTIASAELDLQGGSLTGSGPIFGSVLNGGQVSPDLSVFEALYALDLNWLNSGN